MVVKIPRVKEIKDVNHPENVSAIFSAILNSESEYDREKEHFWMLGLNTKNNVKITVLNGCAPARSVPSGDNHWWCGNHYCRTQPSVGGSSTFR